MTKGKKAAKQFAEAVAVARDEALVEIGEAAALRQEERAGRVRRRKVGKTALVAVAAGAALAAGALALRRRRVKKAATDPVVLSGEAEQKE